MPAVGSHDVLSQPPRPVESRFELAARRLIDTWLDQGTVRCSAEDVVLAADFLKRCGLTAEILPGLEVRLTSARGRSRITTREGTVMAALRCLVTLDAQHASGSDVANAA